MLTAAGYKPVPIAQVSTDVPVNQAIGTEPAAGAAFKARGSVSLFISSGPCPAAGCPQPVPDVVGLPVADAIRHMTDAKLGNTVSTEVNEKRRG